jgi:hypothetical protein
VIPQVNGLGSVTIGDGGLQVDSGLSIPSGGLGVTSGALSITGNVLVKSGALSITSASTTASAFDVYSSANPTFSGSTIRGRLAAGAFGANALMLLQGTNEYFRVGYARLQLFDACEEAVT